MEKITPFKFSLLPGDLINALPGIKALCERMGTKAMIYLGLNIEWQMIPEIAEGRESKITMTEKTMEMLKPLLLSQSYIAGVESFEIAYPERFHAWVEAFKTHGDFKTAAAWYRQPQDMVDLDKHHLVPIGMPYGNIYRWQFYTYPDMACDLSKPWLFVEPNDSVPHDTIIINRTERCRNNQIDYSFLSKYKDRLMFAGLPSEWTRFKQETNIDLPLFMGNDFLELAQLIASCSLFIGNQSLCFSLAEAMKVPRCLEICPFLPNVIPSGNNAFDFYFQSNFEYYVELLANRK
jgi:hypothetical protein